MNIELHVHLLARVAGLYEHARRCAKLARRYRTEDGSSATRRSADALEELARTRFRIWCARFELRYRVHPATVRGQRIIEARAKSRGRFLGEFPGFPST